MAAPQPINVIVNQRYEAVGTYPNQTRNPSVDKRKQSNRSLANNIGTVVEVVQVAERIANKRSSAKKNPLKKGFSYDDEFDELEDIAEDYLADSVGKKRGALGTTINAALEIRARYKCFRALRIIAMYAVYAVLLQLFLALINIFSAGIAYAVDTAASSVQDGVVSSLAMTPAGLSLIFVNNATDGAVGDAAEAVVEQTSVTIKDLTGVDVGTFFDVTGPPIFVFGIMNYTVFLLGVVLMFLTAFVFFFCGVKPFWGRGGTLKMISFCLGMVGYAFPLLNLVPWFLVYAGAVAYDPR